MCEVFGTTGYINTTYTYTPYGSVTATGSTTQPIQWSSEFYDSELGLVYYNYRHYNPLDGRWDQLDTLYDNLNLYSYISNSPLNHIDFIGREMSFSERPCMRKLKKYYKGNNITARDVYIESGGEVAEYYKKNEAICSHNSCALRVSIALSRSRSAVSLEKGKKFRMGEIHFKENKNQQHNILEADVLRKYITRMWGEPDYKFVNFINPKAEEWKEQIRTPDWSYTMRGKCGVVFYMHPQKNKASHTGLIEKGLPYKDPNGSTVRGAYIWLVPCVCVKGDQCELCEDKNASKWFHPIISAPTSMPLMKRFEH